MTKKRVATDDDGVGTPDRKRPRSCTESPKTPKTPKSRKIEPKTPESGRRPATARFAERAKLKKYVLKNIVAEE